MRKIRKRVSSSSSSSSSLVKNYRFKRAILAASSSLVPTRKLKMSSFSKSPLQKLKNFENEVKCSRDLKGKDGLSARKLAASLWDLRSPTGSTSSAGHNFQDRKQFQSPSSEKIDASKVRGHHRRRSSATSQKLQVTEYLSEGLDRNGKASPLHQISGDRVSGEYNSSIKTRLKDVSYTLIASKELVKVLFRILSQEEKHSSRITLVSALKVELDRARLQVDNLIQEQRSKRDEIDTLLTQFAEEKVAWKKKEKGRVKEAVSSLSRELEIERKLRRQAERLNKKLGNELNGERKAREILENACDELAKGIGEERFEVEELKKESEKVREEVEKEREMLQLADVLREERVQMKLMEAKYEFEEKNAGLERLKSDLETYFQNEDHGNIDIKDLLKKTQLGLSENGENVQISEDDSSDSELHTIELKNKSFKWSVPSENGSNQGSESRRGSTDEVFKGRKSLSEKIQWENICLYKKTPEGNGNVISNGFDKNTQFEENGEMKRFNFKAVKSSRLASCHEGSRSPAISTGRSSSSSRLRDACSAILQDLALRRENLEGHNKR